MRFNTLKNVLLIKNSLFELLDKYLFKGSYFNLTVCERL